MTLGSDRSRAGALSYDPESDTIHGQPPFREEHRPSQRQLRVGELIRHALAEMLARGEIYDDVLAAHVVTIPEVRMSPDLRLASIYVMPLGGKDVKPVLAALERNKKYIRGEIAHEVNLKFAPDIRFMADETFDEADRIERLLASDKVRKDLDKIDMARRKKGRAVHGWLVLDKPAGMTSTQAVGAVRRLFDARKAGHAGTLDPLATGILPIALGEATKTVPYAVEGEKGYRFTVRWGVETDTDDAEGRTVVDQRCAPGAAARSRRCCRSFIGEILQTPPAFSAIKIDGDRAYDLARAGEMVELEARPVRIDMLKLVEMPDRRYRRVRGPMRQGHLRACACARHGPGARLPRPCHRAAAHARRRPSTRPMPCRMETLRAAAEAGRRRRAPLAAAGRSCALRACRAQRRPERCRAPAAGPGRADPRPRCADGRPAPPMPPARAI